MSLTKIRKKSTKPKAATLMMARALREHGERDHINPRTAAKRFAQVNARRAERGRIALTLKQFVINYNPSLPYRKEH